MRNARLEETARLLVTGLELTPDKIWRFQLDAHRTEMIPRCTLKSTEGLGSEIMAYLMGMSSQGVAELACANESWLSRAFRAIKPRSSADAPAADDVTNAWNAVVSKIMELVPPRSTGVRA